jgi:hypothetical protein
MGHVRGMRSGHRAHICRKCGEPIRFEPRPGFIVKGQPKYFPVNVDDGKPHYRRCQLNQELKALKSGPRPQTGKPRGLRRRSSGDPPPETVQGELFDAEA